MTIFTVPVMLASRGNALYSKYIGLGFESSTNQISTFVLVNVFQVETWPRGYKTFFVLNSVEHEILNAHKYKNIKKFGLFKAQLSLECYFSPLIHVKMPTIVGILTFMSGENFMLN